MKTEKPIDLPLVSLKNISSQSVGKKPDVEIESMNECNASRNKICPGELQHWKDRIQYHNFIIFIVCKVKTHPWLNPW